MEDRQGCAEYRGGHGHVVYRYLWLVEVQSALAVHEEGEGALFDGVAPSARFVCVFQRSLHCGQPVACGGHSVDEAVSGCVFVVVQVSGRAFSAGAGVQCVDEHIRNGRGSGDLDSRLLEVIRYWGRLPVRGRGFGGGQMPRHDAVFDCLPDRLGALGAEAAHSAGELVVRRREVLQELRREDLVRALDVRPFDSFVRPCHRCLQSFDSVYAKEHSITAHRRVCTGGCLGGALVRGRIWNRSRALQPNMNLQCVHPASPIHQARPGLPRRSVCAPGLPQHRLYERHADEQRVLRLPVVCQSGVAHEDVEVSAALHWVEDDAGGLESCHEVVVDPQVERSA